MNGVPEEDRLLLARCLNGDRKASEIFVRRFSDLVYQTAQYTLSTRQVFFNSQDVDDLHNTVFLSLFEQGCRKLRQYQGRNGCSLATWIRVVTVRLVLNHLRVKGPDSLIRQKRQLSLENIAELEGGHQPPWAQMEKAQQESFLREAIKHLPPRDRLFMKLHMEEGLSLDEVAEIMQLSIQNIHTIKHRAIKRLKIFFLSAIK